MSLSHGMNIEEVRALGRHLQAQKDVVENLIREIESKVQSAGWQGPDAERFRNQSWPQYRSQLNSIGQNLHQFGQDAMRNAQEQEQVSNQ